MSGLAFERALDRMLIAARAGTDETRTVEGFLVHRGTVDMVAALHLGVPREVLHSWIVGMAAGAIEAIADGGSDPFEVVAGIAAQGLLVGFFHADEVRS